MEPLRLEDIDQIRRLLELRDELRVHTRDPLLLRMEMDRVVKERDEAESLLASMGVDSKEWQDRRRAVLDRVRARQAAADDMAEYEQLLARRYQQDPSLRAKGESNPLEARIAELHAKLFGK